MAAAHAQSSSAHEIGVDAHDAVYVLNPSGDLAHTQDTFQGLFQQQPGWQVKPIAPARYSDLHILWTSEAEALAEVEAQGNADMAEIPHFE